MTLKELKDKMNRYSDDEANNLRVVVKLEDASVGPVANTELEGGIAGFDWETGLFIFNTKDPICKYREEQKKDVARYKLIRKFDGVTTCRCPVCQIDIDEYDRFCKNCGQKFHTR